MKIKNFKNYKTKNPGSNLGKKSASPKNKEISTPSILIVEDQSIIAMEIQDRLERLGYSVCDMVSSGEDAITKAMEKKPHLILMDIRLRVEMDGIESARQIKEKLDDVSVIYLTSYMDKETIKRAKISELYEYILKPFEEQELQNKIETTLSKIKS